MLGPAMWGRVRSRTVGTGMARQVWHGRYGGVRRGKAR